MDVLTKRHSLLRFLRVYALSGIVLFFFLFVLVKTENMQHNLLAIALFAIIAAVSFFLYVKSVANYAYSLSMMHWLFCLIFYGIAGFTQYLTNRFVYSLQVSDDILLYALMAILLWMFSFFLGSNLEITQSRGSLCRTLKAKIKPNYSFIVFSTITSVMIARYILWQGGLSSLFSRSTGGMAFSRELQSETLLLSSLMRNFVLYSLVLSLVFSRRLRKGWFLVAVQMLCCLVVNPPLGMARYNVAAVYVGLMLIMFPRLKSNRVFSLIFFLSFVFLFPMINVFRNFSLGEVSFEMLVATVDNIATNFLHGDYDAFSMIINTVNYVYENGISWGYQLLGPLLFFVPRSIWANKPTGSGHTVRVYQGHQFTNVSSPLIAEGIINFGLVGVGIFGLGFGKITRTLDALFWEQQFEDNNRSIDLIYPFLLPLFFFMNRGDLLSTFAYMFSHVAVFFTLSWINNLFLIPRAGDMNTKTPNNLYA